MINHNPYNLPQKVLKQSHLPKQMTNLYRKVSHQHSNNNSNPMKKSGNFTNIPDQLKMSMSPQHYVSVPNNLASNRAIQFVSYQKKETQIQKKMKIFNQKLINISNQVSQHEEKIGYLVKGVISQKSRTIESPLDAEININNSSQKYNKQLNFNIEKVNLILQQFKKQIKQLKIQIKGTSTNHLKTITNQLQHNKAQHCQNRQLGVINSNIEQIKMAIQDRFKKNQKVMQTSTNKIIAVNQKVDTIQTNIENHMELVNNQINNALSKLVTSINQRVTKVLQNNLSTVTQKLKCFQLRSEDKIDKVTKIQPFERVKQLKLSGLRSQSKVLKVSYKNIIQPVLTGLNQSKKQLIKTPDLKQIEEQVVICEQQFFIDEQGYLLDSNKVYLMDSNQNLILLSAEHLQKLKAKFLFA